jgi:hypothetical protein
MTLRKLDRDFARADLAAVTGLLARLGNEDVMARLGLEARLEELQQTVAALEEIPDAPTASAALFFGGEPVAGTRGIESEFAGQAIGKFQDLVSKVLAHESVGLGQRGVVPRKAASTLHITNIVRGSFGFLLEEVQPADQSVTTSLTAAVEEATRLLDAFKESDEEQFRSAAESMDERLLSTTREFFGLMRQSGATFRLVAGNHDRSFGSQDVVRAAERATSTHVEETEVAVSGRLTGVLPESHLFEFRAAGAREVIRGRVHRSLTTEQLATFNRTMTHMDVRARLRIKRVRRSSAVVRENYTLIALDAAEPQLLPDLN